VEEIPVIPPMWQETEDADNEYNNKEENSTT